MDETARTETHEQDTEVRSAARKRAEHGLTLSLRGSARGMTLIEIMVVIAIIGLLAGAVAFGVFTYFKKAKVKAAEAELRTIGTALSSETMFNGEPPSSLDALVSEGHIKAKQLKDPWQQPWIYSPTPAKEGEEFTLCTAGPDKVENSEDDICLHDDAE